MNHNLAVYLSTFAQGIGIIFLVFSGIHLNHYYLVFGALINISVSNIIYFLGHQEGWKMRKHELEKEYEEQ